MLNNTVKEKEKNDQEDDDNEEEEMKKKMAKKTKKKKRNMYSNAMSVSYDRNRFNFLKRNGDRGYSLTLLFINFTGNR